MAAARHPEPLAAAQAARHLELSVAEAQLPELLAAAARHLEPLEAAARHPEPLVAAARHLELLEAVAQLPEPSVVAARHPEPSVAAAQHLAPSVVAVLLLWVGHLVLRVVRAAMRMMMMMASCVSFPRRSFASLRALVGSHHCHLLLWHSQACSWLLDRPCQVVQVALRLLPLVVSAPQHLVLLHNKTRPDQTRRTWQDITHMAHGQQETAATSERSALRVWAKSVHTRARWLCLCLCRGRRRRPGLRWERRRS